MKKHNQKKPISGYEKFITGFKAEFNTWLFTLYTVEKILRIINMEIEKQIDFDFTKSINDRITSGKQIII